MSENTRSFDLNIEKVLEHWTVPFALREIIANALDEQELTNGLPPVIFKDEHGIWHIKDSGRGIRYEHLTQNENKEKQKHPDLVIGKFGVGLKDAFATFDRHKIDVSVISKYGNISIAKVKKHGFSDIRTLHAIISDPYDQSFVGTEFVLKGISDQDIAIAKSLFLQFSGEEELEKTRFGSVIKKVTKKNGRIYVNGLCVAEEDNFLFSYNITSLNANLRKALNRERTNVGRSAYTDRVKDILLQCSSPVVANELAKDLQKFDKGNAHDELQWSDVTIHACKILNATERVIFLTSSELLAGGSLIKHAQDDGYRVVIVPDTIANKLTGFKDINDNPMRELEQYRTEWNQSFQFDYVTPEQLSLEEKKVWQYKDSVIKMIGRKASRVKDIRISKTMRLNNYGVNEASGVWVPDEQVVVIKKDQLKSLRLFAGTLLHELIHATTATDDISEEFEQHLTTYLGMVAANAIQNMKKR